MTPTPEQIEVAWKEATGSSVMPYPDDMEAFARAVLARWGTPTPAGEPVLFVSPEQVTQLTDPEGEHGRYLPTRKTRAGKFTQPLFTAPPAREPVNLMVLINELADSAHGITKGEPHADT